MTPWMATSLSKPMLHPVGMSQSATTRWRTLFCCIRVMAMLAVSVEETVITLEAGVR